MNQEIIPGADDIYPQLGQLIFDAIPDEFGIAWVRVEMIDDVRLTRFRERLGS
ncbi:hypothetical protein [Burkholderia pseudomallei]|uniref:hypothetical protein n=1 Tax=Burkholderia pseudomallei TaxID=28450 RepID=UPI0013E98BB4|nr:hypothetical protein [Burkholderia pseudomallei]